MEVENACKESNAHSKAKYDVSTQFFYHEISLKILVNISEMFFINYSFMEIISGFI